MEAMEFEVMADAAFTSQSASASAPRSGYASTYYPGTPSAAEAQKIALAAGQEVSGADFPLVAVKLARVSGLVVSSDGKPVEGAMISVTPMSRDLVGLIPPSSARSAKDGTFTLNSVAPGDYNLQSRSVQVITTTSGDNNMMVFRTAALGGGGDQEFGTTPLTVAGEDITNVLLTTSKGGTATGQVTFDGPKPSSVTGIRVTSMAVDSDGPAFGRRHGVAQGGRVVRIERRCRRPPAPRGERTARMDPEVGEVEWHGRD